MNPAHTDPAVALFVFLAIGAISLFTFLSVATWAGTQRAEREAFYKTEMLKRIVEIGGQADAALNFLREEDRIGMRKRVAAFKIAGLVNVGLSLGLMLFLRELMRNAIYLVGTIPLFIGVALLVYTYLLSPKTSAGPTTP